MKNILIIIAMLCSFSAISQTESTAKQLIGEEIWRKVTPKTVTIITSSENTKNDIVQKYKGFKRFSATMKKDRKGMYWEYSFYYDRDVYVSLGPMNL